MIRKGENATPKEVEGVEEEKFLKRSSSKIAPNFSNFSFFHPSMERKMSPQ